MWRSALTAVLCLAGGVASAQPTFSEVQRAVMAQQGAQVRVNIGINMFVPDGGGQTLGQEDLRRKVYDMAGKECALLQDTIASDCRMENISVNVSRPRGQQSADGFNVNASIRYRITPK